MEFQHQYYINQIYGCCPWFFISSLHFSLFFLLTLSIQNIVFNLIFGSGFSCKFFLIKTDEKENVVCLK